MERCHGTTKAGERCRRSVSEDSLYCALHVDQAADEPAAESTAEEPAEDRDLLDMLVVVAAAGIAVTAAFAFRRIFRFG